MGVYETQGIIVNLFPQIYKCPIPPNCVQFSFCWLNLRFWFPYFDYDAFTQILGRPLARFYL